MTSEPGNRPDPEGRPDPSDGVTVPPTDPVREAKDRDWGDPADVPIDEREWRDGGPTRTPGARTTTGGRAGRAPVRDPDQDKRERRRTAPTTTGDATTGGMRTYSGGSTSDNEGPASSTANVTDQ